MDKMNQSVYLCIRAYLKHSLQLHREQKNSDLTFLKKIPFSFAKNCFFSRSLRIYGIKKSTFFYLPKFLTICFSHSPEFSLVPKRVCLTNTKVQLHTGASIPSETMMHFPPVSDPPIFSKNFRTLRKILEILPFPEKVLDFHTPKFLMTFF